MKISDLINLGLTPEQAAQISRNGKYWKDRFSRVEQSQHDRGVEAFNKISEQYRKAEKEIEAKIDAWYRRLADNNQVTLQEARKLLDAEQLAEFKWDVNEYIRHGQYNAINGAWAKELENASARYHISRLEALKIQCQQDVEVLFGGQADIIDRTMRDIYKSGYYQNAFTLQKGIGVGWDFAGLDPNHIDKVINTPWAVDGKNFSERIWESKEKLVNEMDQILTQNIILGKDPQKAIDAIASRMNVSKSQAGRLVMTEEAYFSSLAQKDCFKELDVEEFEILATLDNITSDICKAMDGKHFKMSQWEVGVTAPPFHPWCRSTTVPYFEDDFGVVGERAAKDEEGKTYYVPGNMTYKEWEKAFVDGDKEGLKAVQPADTIRVNNDKYDLAEDTQTFDELKQYMKDNYDITIDDSVGKLDFQSVRESIGGVEYVIGEFPQAKDAFKTISVRNGGLMSAGYYGDINFSPTVYATRESVLYNHGLAPGMTASGLHPKGNNTFGSGCHEAGHILEKAIIDKINGGESPLGRLQWGDMTFTKSIVNDACKTVKKLPECKGMRVSDLKNQISTYAGRESNYSASETLAEAVCDVCLNGEDAAILSKEIWKILKKELGKMLLTEEQIKNKYPLEAVKFMHTFDEYLSDEVDEYGLKKCNPDSFKSFEEVDPKYPEQLRQKYEKSIKQIHKYLDKGNAL